MRQENVFYSSWLIPVTEGDLYEEQASRKRIAISVSCFWMERHSSHNQARRERGASLHVYVTRATCSLAVISFWKCQPDVLWPCETRIPHAEKSPCLLFVSVANTCLITFNSPKSLLCGTLRKTADTLIRNLEEGDLPFSCIYYNRD